MAFRVLFLATLLGVATYYTVINIGMHDDTAGRTATVTGTDDQPLPSPVKYVPVKAPSET